MREGVPLRLVPQTDVSSSQGAGFTADQVEEMMTPTMGSSTGCLGWGLLKTVGALGWLSSFP